jgi:glutamyl-tRNA reductase
VRYTEQAVVTTFGKPTRAIKAPGLYWKWPFPFQTSYVFDRIHVFTTKLEQVYTSDGKNIIISAFIGWQIIAPIKFLTRAGTLERAQRLAEEFGGRAYTFSDLPAVLKQADIVISSTGAPGYVLTRREVLPAVEERRHRPMFLIDIAVPRDIDPSLAEVDSLYVYDIDDLQEVVKANMKERLREAETARHIVDSYVERFIRWMRELEVAPLIAELKQKAETIRREELKKRLKGLNLTPEQTAEVENITRIIINKLLHQPIVSVKRKAVESEPHHILQAFREFFGLGKD